MSKPDPYASISETDCPTACSAQLCIISGENICSHPAKGGLQPRYQSDRGVIERRRQAAEAIKRSEA